MKDNIPHIIHQYLNREVDVESVKQELTEEEFNKWSETLSMVDDMPKAKFNVEREFDLIQQKKQENKTSKSKIKYLKIAAILILLISSSVFTFTYLNDSSKLTNITSNEVQDKPVKLPDNSRVRLNTTSSISYSEKNWDKSRRLQLKGEAYFDVEEGNRFIVETAVGSVEVLGTTFNVRSRGDQFSVTCYTGQVKVNYSDKEVVLNPGKTFKSTTRKITKTSSLYPDWLPNKTSFETTPLAKVVQEIEHKKNVVINLKVSDSLYFTGAYDYKMETHEILNLVCNSLDLTFRKIDDSTYEVMSKP
jgi:ferric-dicitrate binding protein FerR (iron transport regulator)